MSELLARVTRVVGAEFPSPVWVRGEVTGFRRTSAGAVFFRLADPEDEGAALEVSGRGRVMAQIDRLLDTLGIGNLRDGIELRVRGTVGVTPRQSLVRLSLIEIDPAFTAGRLALDRAGVIRSMTADRSIHANASLPIPLVPQRIGLVTSRGSAAHADFLHQLERSPYRFTVRTAHTSVQGDGAAEAIAAALGRVATEPVDVVALVRGGGSRLDLAVFDSEMVGRAVASMPIPVITGIGHETDRTVADEAAAIAEKTPSAVGEWVVTRVRDFADRITLADRSLRQEARAALQRQRHLLSATASAVSSANATLARQSDMLERLATGIATSARDVVATHGSLLNGLTDWFAAMGVDPTLRRGFALVTSRDGTRIIRTTTQVSPGDRILIRLADGDFPATVDST